MCSQFSSFFQLNKYLRFLSARVKWAVGWSSGFLLLFSLTHEAEEVDMFTLLLIKKFEIVFTLYAINFQTKTHE